MKGGLSPAMVTSRLEYCNSFYVGLLLNLNPETAAGAEGSSTYVDALSLWMHIQPVLWQLLWLPIGFGAYL